ncbi:hypothetical protein FRC14_002785 [Serendipita sp. 396]|nr:hypothetical protein FRC14_002785 [Serendipita sp. 396]KAG8788731.1 hypothetical protein FRC15_002489 [Serendipita sp. 397]KAG8803751.1 hypothetical protein FRC16_003291 [Serendipita sp. 398]KAG8827353.1 hypothetical protein FRC19_003930 [Serendipita sp. 401]KAG8860608.1 hypothetical protein FRB91_002495 [Serendipita sp. 411]KAG8875118.1 hypothetical protein FRC20_004443 [Serendipita sp. 405]KAG9057708.1 hypothetical protein FS842_004627 [Serendipita sp. 407]
MGKRHARSRSPAYLGYNANPYSGPNVLQPFTGSIYYPPPAPLPMYNSTPALPVTPYPGPYPGPYSYSPAPAPIPQTVYGNRAPLPEEMTALQYTLQMKLATVSFLDAQIEAAKENLELLAVPYFDLRARFESAQSAYFAAKENHEDLVNQRNALDQSMAHLNALLNPLRRFPDDLLVKIFMYAVEAEEERDYERREPPRFRKPQSILNITRVCSKWRGVARGKPELWAFVRLNLSRRNQVHEKLRYFLDLAQGLPMNISTSNLQPNFFNSSTDSEDEEGSSSGALLAPVHKLKSLTVNYTHYRALHHLPALGTSCLDTLEELHLRSEPLSSPASGFFSIVSYLAEAPNLRILRLIHVHLLPPALHEVTPTVSLPRVEELVLHGPTTHGSDLFGFAQIVTMLPNVQKITFFQNDSVPYIVQDEIHLPKLRELTVNCTALENALRTSFGANKVIAPKLEKLTVVDATMTTGGFVSFLEAVETIRELSIIGNFDPFSNIVSTFLPGQIFVLPPIGAVPVPPPPAQIIPLPGAPTVQATNNPPGTGSTTFLQSMRDVQKMEIQHVHPKFLQALCSVIDIVEEVKKPEVTADAPAEGSPGAVTTRKYQAFEFLPNLRWLEITVHKSLPIKRDEFDALFGSRCWRDEEDKGLDLRSLKKLEVHLGANVPEDLANAVGDKMTLDGEEKNCRWFSWTRSEMATGDILNQSRS